MLRTVEQTAKVAMCADEFREDLEVALSGGGYRASAFGLGVLLYLVDSGLNRQTVTITSVSGVSITNGFIASQCDFGAESTDRSTFMPVAARLARLIAGKGKYRGFWLVSRPFLGFLIATVVAYVTWLVNYLVTQVASLGWRVELREVLPYEGRSLLVVGVVWGVAALWGREQLILWWIERSFFRQKETLGSVSGRRVDHVFCATDLTGSAPFFFSTKGGGRVFGEAYGRGAGGKVRLNKAVGASAAIPPLIPPMSFDLRDHEFDGIARHQRKIYLSDGGVWNNLGTDWSRLRSEVVSREIAWLGRTQSGEDEQAVIQGMENCPVGGVLLVVNASKPETRKGLSLLKVPVVSFFVGLIRVVNVMVNSTVAARAQDVEREARKRMLNDPDRWELGGEAPRPQSTVWGEGRGTDAPLAVAVEMDRSPGETASAYEMIGGLKQWRQKPQAYVDELEAALEDLGELVGSGDVVATKLDNLGSHDTLRMIVLGYLNARETLAVAFANHEPPPIPKREWFEGLLL